VDAYSRYVRFYGLHNKSTKAVTTALQQYQADNKPAETFGFINLEKIRTDAGSQFTSSEFADYCREQGVHLSLAAPKNQYQNHLAERTWQTTSTMARALLVHARLPNVFWYHALRAAFDCLDCFSPYSVMSKRWGDCFGRRPPPICLNGWRSLDGV
jgi:transposase InsO family protein